MSRMMAEVRVNAVSRAELERACEGGFMDRVAGEELVKLDMTAVLSMVAGVVAVLTVVRMVNLYMGGA